MSIFTISEFDNLVRDSDFVVTPPVAEQYIEVGPASVKSEPFVGRFIIVNSFVPVALAFGNDPVAVPNLHTLEGSRCYGVNPGQCLAVIEAEE